MSVHRKMAARMSVLVAVALVAGMVILPGSGSAAPSVRGFDGSTIKIAGIGVVNQFPGVPVGTQARMKRFNDTNEIKGVKLEYAGFADDKQDPATTLSEERRLTTQEQVFAIVGDYSANNAGDYLNQQHMPYFGWAFDTTYCSPTPTTKLYGFGFNGCLTNNTPKTLPNAGVAMYNYVSKKTGKKHPTISLFGNEVLASKDAAKYGASEMQAAGFNVVFQKGILPLPPIGDYTPYVQTMLTSDNGKAPDAMICYLQTDCIQMWSQLKAQGYTGAFQHFLYTDFLVKALAGSVASTNFASLNSTGIPTLDQLKKDVEAFKPGAGLDSGVATAYFSTDMFIQALKTIAKKGKSGITPENLQKAAASQTWQMKGLAGPTIYPAATAKSTSACTALELSDGTAWNTVEPFACSSTAIKINPKFQSN